MHLWLERTGELLLSDERVCTGLLWCPSLQGIEIQEAVHEVDKGHPVVDF